MISDTQHFGFAIVPVLSALEYNINFQTDFIYAGLPTPSGFVSSTNLPFLLRTHTIRKAVTVRASFTSYLGFPFFFPSLGFFFFF